MTWQPVHKKKEPVESIKPKEDLLVKVKSPGELAIPDYIQPEDDQQHIDEEDKSLPRLKLLQAMSPEVKLKIGSAGDIINAISTENYGNSITIVPMMFWKMAIKWHPRTPDGSGGGLVDICDNLMVKDPVSRNGEDMTIINWTDELIKSNDKSGKGGDYWAKVYNFLVLINEDTVPIILSLARTKIRAAKKLIGFYDVLLDKKTLRRYPWYAKTYQINVVEENKGDWSYFNYDVMPVGGWTEKNKLSFASKLVAGFKDKEVKVDLEGVDGEEHQ